MLKMARRRREKNRDIGLTDFRFPFRKPHANSKILKKNRLRRASNTTPNHKNRLRPLVSCVRLVAYPNPDRVKLRLRRDYNFDINRLAITLQFFVEGELVEY